MRHLATSHCVAPSTTAGLPAKSTRQGLFCQGLKHTAEDGHVSDRTDDLPAMMSATNRPFDTGHIIGAGFHLDCDHQAHGLAA